MSKTTNDSLPKPPTPRHLRFSLRTLLLMLVLVTLSASHLYTSYRLWRSEGEVRQQRDQLGILRVADPHRIHVLPLELQEGKAWRWRLFLPEGRRYELRESFAQIPAEGVASNFGSTTFSPGEHELTARIQRDDRGQWALMLFFDTGSVTALLPAEQTQWLTRAEGGFRTDGVIGTVDGRKTEQFPCDVSVVLLRVRADVKDPGGGWNAPAGPASGVLLWIEPVE